MRRRTLAQLILALCFVTAQMGAQVAPGDRVRILHGSGRDFVMSEGSFVGVTADSVYLADDSTKATRALPRDSVYQVERRIVVGRRGLRGAGIGLLTGVVGGAAGGALTTHCPQYGECEKGLNAMIGGVAGAVYGLVAGSIIGLFVPHHEWTLVALPPRATTSGIAGVTALQSA